MVGNKALAVFASGRGSNLQAIMEAIANGKLDMELVLVLSDQPDARALDRARRAGVATEVLPFTGDAEGYGEKLLRYLAPYSVDVIALAGFMRIVPPNFLRDFPGDIVNIHPSLLPAFPGLDAQEQAVDYGVRVSGCTVHFVDEGVDTGPVILQASVPVYASDDEDTLSARILRWEHRLYPRALQLYAEDRLKRCGRKVKILDE